METQDSDLMGPKVDELVRDIERLTRPPNEEVLDLLLESYKMFDRIGWPKECSELWWKLFVSVYPFYLPGNMFVFRALSRDVERLASALYRLAFNNHSAKMKAGTYGREEWDVIQGRYPLAPLSAAKRIEEFCDAMGIPGKRGALDED